MTTNPYLIKCAALALKEPSEKKPEEEQGQDIAHPKLPTVAGVAKTQLSLAKVLLEDTTPTLNDLAKPY